MKDGVGSEFRRRVEELLARRPHTRCTWSDDRAELSFPREHDGGFDVLVEIGRDEVIVHAGGGHEHFHGDEDPAGAALQFVVDLLGPDMRVRELCSGRSPYRWFVEARQGGEWRTVCENGLLFFNYFGRRSQRIYRNGPDALEDTAP